MAARKSVRAHSSSKELGLKLLQSVREMQARQFARTTGIEVNEVVRMRRSMDMLQADFASALSISKRTLQK